MNEWNKKENGISIKEIFEKDGKFGIILLNETSEPMTFRFSVKDFSGVLHTGDKIQVQGKEAELKLPAGEAIFCRGE